jgi:hypothetical protein
VAENNRGLVLRSQRGRILCRIVEQRGATRQRRDRLIHPLYQKPKLPATAPNQELGHYQRRGPAKLARKLIQETCEQQNIQPGRPVWPRPFRFGTSFLLNERGVRRP